MSACASFDFSGLGVRLRGVPDDVAPLLREEWSIYLAEPADPFLDLGVEEGEFPMPGGTRMSLRLDGTFRPGSARFQSDEGEVELDGSGRGQVLLGRGTTGRRLFGLMSLITAASGWTLSRGRGLALHAAGVVLDGRAFLLVGPSGAGKTTWANAVRAAGGLVLSDDVVVVETDEAPVALAVPFRVRPFAPPPPGRWPVAALLLSRHGPSPVLRDVARLTARALLAANVLYVDPAFRLGEREGSPLASLADLPVRELTFGPDPSFVPLLRSFVP